jgi:hypothetical protein
MAKPAVTRSPKPEPLSRAQREMMGWFNNNHLIAVEGKYAVLTSSREIIGMANTVHSLERKGLIEEDVRISTYGRPKFTTYRKCQQPPEDPNA